MSSDEISSSRRDVLKGVAVVPLTSGWVDKDGDGDYLDDILNLNDHEEAQLIIGLAADREGIVPEGDEVFFAIDTGAWYEASSEEWEKVATTGLNPLVESTAYTNQDESEGARLQWDSALNSMVVVK